MAAANFETLVGQEHVVRALTHALDEQRLHHAYLFTGTRGVGKTTLSRILAKCLNCIGPDGSGDITSTPCGVCAACTEIDAGRFVDYIEMDAASNRGVDEMAQLLEQAIYAPANARFKVYMIDEVHMLTNHAFNAMLKTLEEPPEHVKFILATTDPQKIPVTVLSRCLQFNLKQMPVGRHRRPSRARARGRRHRLRARALRLLGRAAAGSMRDALSLTDQAIAFSAGQVAEAAVRGMLGALDQTYLLRILDALADGDGPDADDGRRRDRGAQPVVRQRAAGSGRAAASDRDAAARAAARCRRRRRSRCRRIHLRTLAGRLSPEDVQLHYQIAAHGRRDLSLAPDEVTGFSMTLLRMLAFRTEETAHDGRDERRSPDRVAARGRRATGTGTAEPALAEAVSGRRVGRADRRVDGCARRRPPLRRVARRRSARGRGRVTARAERAARAAATAPGRLSPTPTAPIQNTPTANAPIQTPGAPSPRVPATQEPPTPRPPPRARCGRRRAARDRRLGRGRRSASG